MSSHNFWTCLLGLDQVSFQYLEKPFYVSTLGPVTSRAIILQYFRMRSVFFFVQAVCQFLDTCLKSDSSMGVPMNQRSCGHISTVPDRHQVRNVPVTLVGQLKKSTKKQTKGWRRVGVDGYLEVEVSQGF